MTNGAQPNPIPHEVKIRVHDGVEIAVALYMPEGTGPLPVLLAPSPYRYDNNSLPASPQFLWRETGPIDFYLKHGYVYANMDVRGSGKSGGESTNSGPSAWNDNRYKLVKVAADKYELYDLTRDLSETTDLAAAQPEIVNRMKAELEEWQQSVLRSNRGEDYPGK